MGRDYPRAVVRCSPPATANASRLTGVTHALFAFFTNYVNQRVELAIRVRLRLDQPRELIICFRGLFGQLLHDLRELLVVPDLSVEQDVDFFVHLAAGTHAGPDE